MSEPPAPPPGPGAGLVDWNEAWQAARARTNRRRGRESWDKRAPSFSRAVAQSGFIDQVLARLPLDPTWDVLDVGCGSGTLAVPLAGRVRAVTALDYSPRMLDLLRERCAAEGLGNVAAVLGAWEDDWAALGIGRHDVALASRSLTADDLRGSLRKLDRAARQAVHVVAPVGSGPIDGRAFEVAGRTFTPGPDYIYPCNLLHQMGIFAAVDFVSIPDTRRYTGVEDALEGFAWMLTDPTADELARLRGWVTQRLVEGADGWRLTEPRTVQWAILSWKPGALR